ncbi:hypothetical protein AtubIFM55763_000727 [Aspergillus tubingensis]|nr:hypothetical protein AtubIFM55763_000727 [Aspergillus tubingensis]
MREADGIRIAVDEQLTDGVLRYRMKRGGENTTFEQVTKSRHLLAMGIYYAFEVHRRPQDVESIFRSLEAGIGLAKMHRDTTVVQHIQSLQSDFQAIIKETWSRKHALSDKLQTRLEQISTEQARLKQTAMQDAKAEVDNSFREAGARLADCVNAMAHKMASAAEVVSDSDNFSEPDIDKILLEAEKTEIAPFAELPG